MPIHEENIPVLVFSFNTGEFKEVYAYVVGLGTSVLQDDIENSSFTKAKPSEVYDCKLGTIYYVELASVR